MSEIKNILMRRDGMTPDKADKLVEKAKADLRKRLAKGELPDDICYKWFGLEEDYIEELIYE